MPMMTPATRPGLCLCTDFGGMSSDLFIAYVFDPAAYDLAKTPWQNFRPRNSPVHVGVLCAQLIGEEPEPTYEVTNVKAVPGSNVGPYLYYVALQHYLWLRPDRSFTSPEAQRVWDRMDPRVQRSPLGSYFISDADNAEVPMGPYFDNFWRFAEVVDILNIPKIRGEILWPVLEGFAVVDMERD